MPDQLIVHEGTFRPEQEKSYVHLPFEVPAGATRLEIRYSYSDRIGSDPHLSGGNTLDLGVFDSRGVAFLGAGFRGWSGSELSVVSLGEVEATPGYLAGPLTPGQWHVMLGLYKIGPAGCTYRVTVAIATEPSRDPRARLPLDTLRLPASMPPAPFAPWLRGELHCHTWHSDGDGSPIERILLARERGLDFLAVTDHNTTSSQHELAGLESPGLVLLRGVEVTTFKGHFNVWGIGDWVDFRVRSPEDMAAAIRFAIARGAVTSCNHPKPFGPPWEYVDVADYHCIEVWNGPWHTLNQASLDFWLSQLAAGRRIPAVGGSDYHRKAELAQVPPRAPGTPTVWAYVPGAADEQAILAAIRRGHVSLSDEPDGPLLELRAGDGRAALGGDAVARPKDGQLAIQVRCRRGGGCRLRLLDQRGALFEQLIGGPDELVSVRLPVDGSLYVRAELRDGGAMRALTNPIYLDGSR
jgi:hypothetical protein